LPGEAPARAVGVIPPPPAEGSGVCNEPVDLAARALVLGGERVLEREELAAERDPMLVLGIRPVDRVPDERDQPCARDERASSLRCERVEEIARARFAH